METLADRYDYDSEIMREIVRNKLSYTEMPIHVRYTEYSQKKQIGNRIVERLRRL